MPVNSFENYPMSWRPDKTRLTAPLYLSLANQLEYDILNGVLPPHTRLPPQRELADFLDVNLSTVTRALKHCELKGLTYGVVGRGTFVSPLAEAAPGAERTDCIELGSVNPFDSCNRVVVEAAKYVLSKGYAEKLLDYGHPLGSPHQRQVAARWLSRLGLETPAEEVAVASGAQNALVIALISLFQPGDAIAVEPYTMSNFIQLADMLHMRLVPVEQDGYGMRPDLLEAACRREGVRGVYLMPSCQMPTALEMDVSRREELARVIRERELIALEDDVYSFLAPPDTPPLAALAPEQTVHICSMSKSLAAGLRVAFLTCPPRRRQALLRGIYNVNVKTPSFNTEVVCTLIESGVAEEIVGDKLALAEERNQVYRRSFPVGPGHENPRSFCRWLALPAGTDSRMVEEAALKLGVRVYGSHYFRVGGREERSFLRVALSSPRDCEELEHGLALLSQAIAGAEERPAGPSAVL